MPIKPAEMIKKTVTVPAVAEQVFDLVAVRCVRIADAGCNGPVYMEAEVSSAKSVDGVIVPSKEPTVLVRVTDISTDDGAAVLNALRSLISAEITRQNLL